ncbi:MAG: beta-ketoacyl-ACP synthase 3 [Bryobacteraceae bacterium]
MYTSVVSSNDSAGAKCGIQNMRHSPVNLDKVRIRSTGWYVPSAALANEEIVKGLPTSSEWVVENLGVRQRHISGLDEFSSDLAAAAGLDAISNGGVDKNDVDLIIVATATPDRKAPSTACIVQTKMGITSQCPSFDIAAVCSGFLYGLTTGAQFIQSGVYERVLVIGVDTFSKITDWKHRNCVFFGDGAGAVVLERRIGGSSLFSSILFADGAGKDHFTVFPQDTAFTMNARAVYDTATTVLPAAIMELLSLNGLSLNDVTRIIPHQPSIRVLRKTAELLDIPFDRIHTNLESYANTASATVPLLLAQVNAEGLIAPGDVVLFAAVGAGWTWGAAVYRWD